jgi:hypothetical protein
MESLEDPEWVDAVEKLGCGALGNHKSYGAA